jgi:transcriptional regulator with XRE-family HTH domain
MTCEVFMKFKVTAQLVRKTRQKLELSQKDLADRIGVHIQAISNIERAISGIPASRAKSFAKVLNIPVKVVVNAAVKDYFSQYLKKIC